jgi:hypothetical protein
MKRPNEPEFLVQWRAWYEAGPPKCCHTCDHYSQSGECLAFDMRPPDDFAASVDECKDWIQEMPF